MGKSHILGMLSIACFTAILFNPKGTNYWIWLLVLGILFGFLWFIMKE
ncbi:MAG TPA: hypothetical protein VMC07_01800 [Candidatus Omnitrophota bacterium]|nr:hypothetical protein [Candidatus Omnitrophota bacterium]